MSALKYDVLQFVEESEVKFIRLQFTDIFGIMKNMTIPSHQLERAFDEGVMFDASAIAGFTEVEESDMYLHPDPDTICIIPWRPQQGKVARLICDIKKPDGTQFEGDSRHILKKYVDKAAKKGYIFHIGPECVFFLFHTDADGLPTTKTHDTAGYFDLAPIDLGENARREICLVLEEMGFEIEASHHETAAGQHEIDFKYDDALKSADNIMTFKMVVKTIAQRNGLHATFMPKPLMGVSGSGMHINMSLSKAGENIFTVQDENGFVSKEAKQFTAGILAHIKGITAIANPLINSYKRLIPGFEAPIHIAWSYMNRTPLLRVPASKGDLRRLELRSPDPTCNPYLTLALILAAGLSGIENELVLPPPIDINAYNITKEDEERLHLDKLPSNLNMALERDEKG